MSIIDQFTLRKFQIINGEILCLDWKDALSYEMKYQFNCLYDFKNFVLTCKKKNSTSIMIAAWYDTDWNLT